MDDRRASSGNRHRAAGLALVAGLAACATPTPESSRTATFDVAETTIEAIHDAMVRGDLTARALVEAYVARIDALDRAGPRLNAIVMINPNARERADELDERLRSGGLVGPLHGIPVIVKDNYDTGDMPTSAGSASLANSRPPDDAYQVRKLREAGAIVLAKSNMAEFAFSPYHTVGSRLPGHTRNPYALSRVPAGSSGGTAAAIAANLGVVGLGTDTGNSIRGPSSHNALVGIRSTMGLTSRDGIVPLYMDHDIGGPMARTVADAVKVFDIIAGHDPADPITAASREPMADGTPRRSESYIGALRAGALAGSRIGVVRQLSDTPTADAEIRAIFEAALEDLRGAGAATLDVSIAELESIPRNERWCRRFRHDLDAYLATVGDGAPYRNLDEIIASGLFHHSIAQGMRSFQAARQAPEDDEGCRKAWDNGRLLGAGVRSVIESNRLDALVYPTWSNPPRLIGDLESPAGDNSQDLSPHTGFPAITVPMGYARSSDPELADPAYGGPGLPAGITFLGVAWSETRLIELAYSYEQVTRHRRPPATATEVVAR